MSGKNDHCGDDQLDDAAIGGRCPAPVPLLAGQTASLPVLRAKGAFVVSAQYDGKQVTSLKLTSERGETCRIALPQKDAATAEVRQNGETIKTIQKDGILSFTTEAGKEYDIQFLPDHE